MIEHRKLTTEERRAYQREAWHRSIARKADPTSARNLLADRILKGPERIPRAEMPGTVSEVWTLSKAAQMRVEQDAGPKSEAIAFWVTPRARAWAQIVQAGRKAEPPQVLVRSVPDHALSQAREAVRTARAEGWPDIGARRMKLDQLALAIAAREAGMVLIDVLEPSWGFPARVRR